MAWFTPWSVSPRDCSSVSVRRDGFLLQKYQHLYAALVTASQQNGGNQHPIASTPEPGYGHYSVYGRGGHIQNQGGGGRDDFQKVQTLLFGLCDVSGGTKCYTPSPTEVHSTEAQPHLSTPYLNTLNFNYTSVHSAEVQHTLQYNKGPHKAVYS